MIEDEFLDDENLLNEIYLSDQVAKKMIDQGLITQKQRLKQKIKALLMGNPLFT